MRFDIFLLQCWSEMALDLEHERTFRSISFINDKPPEICMDEVTRYMDRIAPDTQGERLEEPRVSGPWTAHETMGLDRWQDLQPKLAHEHRLMFVDYARHLSAEFALEIEAIRVFTKSCPTGCFKGFLNRRSRFLQAQLNSYIDYVVILAQRDLGMGTTPSLSSGSLITASLPGPATTTNEMDIDPLLHGR